jgi:AmmeMemoRadiSam system protein B
MKKAVCIILFLVSLSGFAQDVRPVRDDVGFCWQRPQMERLMALLAAEEPAPPARDGLVAAVSPHDDYLYAGRIYYPLFRDLRTKEAVIFGVTHGTVRKEIGDPKGVLILDEFPAWAGLGGTVEISPLRDALKTKLGKDDFIISNQAHSLEHSIEALMPWLQYFNPQIRITPIMVTAMPLERMQELSARLAAVLAGYMQENGLRPGRDIVFLVSADANHYGRDFNNVPFGEDEEAHRLGTAQDLRFAEDAFSGRLDEAKIRSLAGNLWGATYLEYGNTYWCGKYDIPFGLLAIMKTLQAATGRGMAGRVLRYSDSYSEGVMPLRKPGFGTTAPFSLKHWVGYVAAAFRLD